MEASLEQLRRKNPEYDQWRYIWPDYRLAYKGGFEFIWQAGTQSTWRYGSSSDPTWQIARNSPGPAFSTPRRRFLKQLEGEPNEVYLAVWDRAEYVNYLGGMLNYFDSWLFSTPPIVQAKEGDEKPDWWEEIERDCTGNRLGFFDFVKKQFLEALLCRRAGWMLGQQSDVAGDKATLTPFCAEEIWDWECDEAGELLWVVLGKTKDTREFPGDRLRTETITYLDRQEWTTWQVIRSGENQTEEATKIGEGVHGLNRIPFVMLEIPHGLWVTDKLYAWAMGLFNQWTRLRNAMLLGCILQPAITTSENRETAQSRIIGEGILLHLRAGDAAGGGEEKFQWLSPDVSPLEFIWSHFKEAVAEGYRIIHQMSMAVDAKSVASIARSGTSKVEDRKATEVILKGFGSVVKDAEMRTLSLLSDVYGDKTIWTVDGYDDFSVSEPLDLMQFLALGQTFGIESPTYKKRLKRKVARLMLDGEDESTMKTVEDEIDEAEDQAQEVAAQRVEEGFTPDGKPVIPEPLKVPFAKKNGAPPPKE